MGGDVIVSRPYPVLDETARQRYSILTFNSTRDLEYKSHVLETGCTTKPTAHTRIWTSYTSLIANFLELFTFAKKNSRRVQYPFFGQPNYVPCLTKSYYPDSSLQHPVSPTETRSVSTKPSTRTMSYGT